MKPEDKLKQFLEAWSRKDYGKMYDHCQLTWKDGNSKAKLKDLITVKIKGSEIKSVNNLMPTMTDIDLVVLAAGKSRKLTCRLIKETEPYKASESGTWGVNPISIIKGLYN